MLAVFWFPSSAQNGDFRCLEGTFDVSFCVFCGFCNFWEVGTKKRGKMIPNPKNSDLLSEVIFGTFATLCAACFSAVFLEVTFPHFL